MPAANLTGAAILITHNSLSTHDFLATTAVSFPLLIIMAIATNPLVSRNLMLAVTKYTPLFETRKRSVVW